MAKRITFPKVLLVGRTNVGKSTLFNRLVKDKKSIVLEMEGVTRDYLEEVVNWQDTPFTLVDTGGLQFKKNIHSIDKLVQEKVVQLFESAGLILFVCDAKAGVTPEDMTIAKALHKTNKPVLLLINKADNKKYLDDNYTDFMRLGFKTIFPVSAVHGEGISKLLDYVISILPEATTNEAPLPKYRVSIIGKPNVGKSSLMNLLVKRERSIVSDVPGTTREAISEPIYFCDNLIQLTDTPGIRKKRAVTEDIESLMVKSSMKSVRESDLVILMIDSSAGSIADQELKLLFMIYELKKPLLIIFNKSDIVEEYAQEKLESSLKEYDFIFKKLPILYTSCLTEKNVGKVIVTLDELWERCKQKINSTEVDDLVKQELAHKPLYHNGIQLKLFKIRTIEADTPTFVLHVNHPEWFGPSQLGCIENILRKHYPLKGCPINFSVRKI